MNIIRELRKRKGMKQIELAATVGVAVATVSDWETHKKDPSGERLLKLSEFFGVDPLVILGKGVVDLTIDGKFIREQHQTAKTIEAKLISAGVDKMSEADRVKALNMMKLMFAEYADYFENRNDDDARH
ncbi:MAG: helix-turn-helix transcriptional regulator [Clostridia bacterium]|nr:helix-turn-helix transcriptional regulator [Clostridia bacterium]